jgi:hypothetical protein
MNSYAWYYILRVIIQIFQVVFVIIVHLQMLATLIVVHMEV